MQKVRVLNFSVSLDGFGAGPNQSVTDPLGTRGLELHQWLFKTRKFHEMTGEQGGETGADNDVFVQSMTNVGAWIMGRNMFGPIRDEWTDDTWQGWWGENPPFHAPVFVLTHHRRPAIEMEGGTTFHFITDGIESALRQAKKSAGARDVGIGGGVSTIRQFLKANLIDEMHLSVVPVALGRGEALLYDIDICKLGFKVIEHKNTSSVMHVRIGKSG